MNGFLWTAVLATCLAPLAAVAQAPTEVDVSEGSDEANAARAREVFQAGQTAFAEGRFEEASSLWLRAYELADRPAILYNIGTAYDRAGDEARALDYYRRYLDADPDAANGAYTRSRIDVLTRTASATDDEPAPIDDGDGAAPVAPPAASAEPEARRAAPAIALFAVAGAAGVTGLALGLRAIGTHSELEDACPGGACDESERAAVDRMGRVALAADVLLGISLASALAAVVALVVGAPSDEAPPVEASCTREGCGVTLRGAF